METEVKLFGCLFSLLGVIALCVAVNCYHGASLDAEHRARLVAAKVEAIKSGADPLAVSCAFDGAGQLCAVLTAKR